MSLDRHRPRARRRPARIARLAVHTAFFLAALWPAAVLQAQPGPAAWRPAAPDTGRVLMLSTPAAADDDRAIVLVTFVEPPLFLARTGVAEPAAGLYATRFDQLAADLAGAAGAAKSGWTGADVEVEHAFYRVFFGAKVRLPQGLVPAVAALPYVKRVEPDAEVAALLDPRDAQEGPGAVAPRYETGGEGVTVGIVDSGVDYLHPALGGGFGDGFKVIGGYDFVDDDADPMDDNGHGTHVAGIVAAGGDDMRGVAPGVRLVAYKVLGASGRGRTSDIIKAIERAVDPDQDGDPRDRLDVLNLSLGTDEGSPDDAASIAVDNAVRLGVVVVVAAGNRGDPTPTQGREHNYYYDGSETVGSPGTARRAITVGAVDAAGGEARFSSKGPVAPTFAGKPDVVAPGVDVRSTWIGGGYAVRSGTSMAAPYVAGVAALLRASHPDWPPERVKAALMNTAHDAGLPVMRQGAGRVDARRAAEARTHVVPAHLSFGMNDALQPTWTTHDTVWVYNLAAAPQAYTVSFAPLPAGVALAAAPEAFTVPAGDSARVVFTLSVDNGRVPVVPEDIELYGGRVRLAGTEDGPVALPWSFARTSVLRFTFSEPAGRFVGVSPTNAFVSWFSGGFNKVRWFDARRAEVYGVDGGVYDVVSLFEPPGAPPRLVVREGVAVGPGGAAVHVDAADAVHGVHFDGVDEGGAPLRAWEGAWQMLYVLTGGEAAWIGATARPADAPALYVSPTSQRLTFVPVQVAAGAERVYVPQLAPFAGISGDVRLTNDAGAYVRQHLRFRLPGEGGLARRFTEFAAGFTRDGEDHIYGGTYVEDTVAVSGKETAVELFLGPPAGDTYFVAPRVYFSHTNPEAALLDLSTPYFSAADGRMTTGLPGRRSETAYRAASGDTMTFGGAPVVVVNRSFNNSFGAGTIHFDPLFLGGLDEERHVDVTGGRYAVYDEGGTLVREAPLAEPRQPLEVTPGRYRLEISAQHYPIGDTVGRVTLVNQFDLRREMADAPYLLSVRLLDAAGRSTDTFRRGAAVRLVFAARMVGPVSGPPRHEATRVFVRRHGTTDWLAVPVEMVGENPSHGGTLYAADLGTATHLDSAAVDVRLEVGGHHDNTAELLLEPAFVVGAWHAGTGTGDGGGEVPAAPELEPGYPNPFGVETRLSFSLPRPAHVSLVVYDVLGREVATLVSELRPAGRHTERWQPEHLASGVYFCRMTADGQVRTRRMVVVR